MDKLKLTGIVVNGVVTRGELQPYIQLMNEDGHMLGQLTMAMARNVAADIVQMCARTEADAMIMKFFLAHELPEAAGGQLLVDFREFRYKLDMEPVEKWATDPDTGLPPEPPTT